jgi:hypothetical protein
MTGGIGLGMQLLEGPVPLDHDGQALLPLEQASHQGGSGYQAPQGDGCRRIGALEAADLRHKGCGDCRGGAQGTVPGENADHMVLHLSSFDRPQLACPVMKIQLLFTTGIKAPRLLYAIENPPNLTRTIAQEEK